MSRFSSVAISFELRKVMKVFCAENDLNMKQLVELAVLEYIAKFKAEEQDGQASK